MIKKIICILFIIISFIPNIVFSKEKIVFDEKNKLNIDYHYNDFGLPNAKFYLYRVANIDEDNNYEIVDKFINYELVINNEDMSEWGSISDNLQSIVQLDSIEYDYTYTTRSDGEVDIKDLPVGLYLLTGDKLSYKGYTYTPKPTLITMPYYNNEKEKWDYDLIVIPKVSRIKEIPEEERYITKKIIVAWNDNENYSKKRPNELKVKLLCDGEVYDEVSLNQSNDWQHTWEKLEAYDENYAKRIYTIVQDDIKYYSVVLEESGTVFSIVNTYVEEKPKEEKLPQTGLLWWPIPILFILGVIFTSVGIYKCRSKK